MSSQHGIRCKRIEKEEKKWINPTEEVCAVRDMYCYAILVDLNTGMMYSDQTGMFPVRSYSNMQLIFVAYIYDINAIIGLPLKTRTSESIIGAFQKVLKMMTKSNCKPVVNVMDNKCRKAVQEYITVNGIDIELCLPKNHYLNGLGKRTIGTYKAHFINTLATVDPNCPMQLWDTFLEQTTETLNILRTLRQNTKKAAYEELNGKFDYNKTPIVPVGIKALVYNDPSDRTSFEARTLDTFVVSRAQLHYRCFLFWIPATKGFCISDTYKLYPAHCRLNNETLIAAQDMLKAYKQLTGKRTVDKIARTKMVQKLSDIIGNAAPRTSQQQPVLAPATLSDPTAP